MSRRNKKRMDDGPKGDDWIVTYSDTITLLLTFFVLLQSMSTVDSFKFRQMAAAIQSALVGESGRTILDLNPENGEVPIVGQPLKTAAKPGNDTKAMYEEIHAYVQQSKMKGKVQVVQDQRGVLLRLRDNVLFDTGKADIKSESKEILNIITNMFLKFPQSNIIVEGHTDNVPINTYKFPSNWELSTARAVNVLKYFVETNKMNPGRFTAAGYGEYRPIASNNSDSDKAKNRRVNIIITSPNSQNKGETK
ncbi:OmpA family protein [Haloimpatiens sp. FM7330]|uniref:OmpA family protein n=1 Tax=Haloimpatiens sp. FM7330 TaxID=3298610 RepID=UPI003632E265